MSRIEAAGCRRQHAVRRLGRRETLGPMEPIRLLLFITGLTTGGLSCLAVQGGLLAGSIATRSSSR